MATNNIINSPFPTILSKGGMNASLTASNGGIFYSTASAGGILAGTPTANQMLQSGASAAPVWSTATYPATTTINQLLYSSATNAVTQITSVNSASLITNNSGTPALSSSMTNGQVIIGSTSGTPTPATLTAGTNVTITNGPGSITINSTAGGSGSFQWIATQTASFSASLNFDNKLSSTYVAYRIVIDNLLPPTSAGSQLYLRLGTGTGTITYIATGYIYQLLDIGGNGSVTSYPGYTGTAFNQAQLTYGGGNGMGGSTLPAIEGTIDLYVTSGSTNVANGRSFLGYKQGSTSNRMNTMCAFQHPAANFTSVQILLSSGSFQSGSVYLYGLLPS